RKLHVRTDSNKPLHRFVRLSSFPICCHGG
ncbi:hypothetical protein EE612_005314, partial [Oryza sativa]